MKKRVLSLNKTTIANLQKVEQNEIRGGAQGKPTDQWPPVAITETCVVSKCYACPSDNCSGGMTCDNSCSCPYSVAENCPTRVNCKVYIGDVVKNENAVLI